MGFYEREEFRCHSYTTSKKGKGIGAALLGILDLSIVEHFKWVVLDTVPSFTVPNLKTKKVAVKNKKFEIMLLSTSDKVNVYRIDEPSPGFEHIRVKKLGFISIPKIGQGATHETLVEMVIDYVEERKLSHIIIANGNLIYCYQIVLEAIDPEVFNSDYVLFGLHSVVEIANPVLSLNYMANGLCCFIDSMG